MRRRRGPEDEAVERGEACRWERGGVPRKKMGRGESNLEGDGGSRSTASVRRLCSGCLEAGPSDCSAKRYGTCEYCKVPKVSLALLRLALSMGGKKTSDACTPGGQAVALSPTLRYGERAKESKEAQAEPMLASGLHRHHPDLRVAFRFSSANSAHRDRLMGCRWWNPHSTDQPDFYQGQPYQGQPSNDRTTS